jgi:hypothetical protein
MPRYGWSWHPVAGYRAGNGDAAIFNAYLMLIQIDADNGLKAWIIQPGIGFRREISPLFTSHNARRAFVPPTSPTKAYFVILLLLR